MPGGPDNPEVKEEIGTPVPFRFHPRVFAALGADLVTSDLVAVIELVKNSYDAFAPRVDVRFLRDGVGKLYLEIEDNGLGMNDKTIENVWCVVATPFRVENPTSERQTGGEKKQRRVSGAKGLGRLSVARLGEKLELFTKQRGGKAWNVTVDWNKLADADDLEHCTAFMRQAVASEFSHEAGTLLRVTRLHSDWPENEIDELADGLSRLKPPFKQLGDFTVFLTDTRNSELPVEIKTSKFIDNPVYQIKGKITESGFLSYHYNYQPYSGKNRLAAR
ncbi:MAG TPA: ATP-binding protein [Verrucomicrobiae bacterium]|nr:ATP-binding protein [Verrucomicrobiae bacterium]